MKNYTFHWDIRTIMTQFEAAFNDIVIKRFNKEKESKEQIHVNFRYSPKTRTLHEIVQKNAHFKLPVVSISIGGLTRNVNRVFNKIEGSYWSNSTFTGDLSGWYHLLQPIPIDIIVNMSIITRYQADLDQILTNFIPYCNPYVVVSQKWPDIPIDNFEIRSHIKWNDNVQIQYPNDIANNVPYRMIADTSFTIESWMFKNQEDVCGPIYVIDTSFTAVNELSSYEVMKNWEIVDE